LFSKTYIVFSDTDNNTLAHSFVAFDPKMELIAQAYADPAWLNATFSLLSLHHDLAIGKKISTECLFHRGQALKMVNECLSNATETQSMGSDSLMAAIALLANFDVRNKQLLPFPMTFFLLELMKKIHEIEL
jgi:hypothetical protein